MRIHYLSTSSLPSQNASSVHVINMAYGLHCAGATVSMTAFSGEAETLARDSSSSSDLWGFYGIPACFEIDWLRRDQRRGRATLQSVSAALQARRRRPDLVLGRYPRACALTSLMNLPTIFETHKPLSWCQPIERFLIGRMFRSKGFRGIVTISRPLQAILLAETGLPAKQVLVAHDAAMPVSLDGAQTMRAGGRLQVGYIGSLYAGRGIELILEVARRTTDAEFHVIGGATQTVEMWRESGKVPGNVIFHGFRSPVEATKMRLSMDILLAPYQEDTRIAKNLNTAQWMSPIKIFEYMASGKPILCSDLPVLREVLRDGQNALLLPPDNPVAWAAALSKLKTDPGTVKRLAQTALRDFEQHYTWEQRAQKIIDFAGA